MLQIIPLLCLVLFVLFLEIRLKREIMQIEEQFKEFKKLIDTNALGIKENKANIDKLNHE